MKLRKPRKTSYGYDYDGAHFNGQPVYHETPAQLKAQKRLKEGLCLGCGQKECKCKKKDNRHA